MLWALACTITAISDTGVPLADTGRGDTGTPGDELSSGDDGPCPAYSGFVQAGSSWTYSYDDGGGSYGTETRSIRSFSEPVDGIWEVIEDRTMELSADGLPVSASSTWVWDCNADGLWLHYAQGTQATEYEGTVTESAWDRRYREGEWLFMARDIGVGTTWTSNVVVTRRGNGTVDDDRLTARAEVTDTTTMIVGAGTFAALEVTMAAEDDTVGWYASGVGMIAEGWLELTEFSP